MGVHLTRRRRVLPAGAGTLRSRARRLLALLHASDRDLSILLTDDAEMTTLNRRYRRKNRTTDVLAFPQDLGLRGGPRPEILGDVVISVPTASRQARERGSTLLAELTVLLVHGVLHLLAWEHEGVDARTAARMFREQERLAGQLNGGRRR